YKATLQLAPGDKQIMARLQGIEERRRGAAPAPPAPAPVGEIAPSAPTILMSVPRPPAAPVSAPAPVAAEPPPIPLVAAEEEFEIERPGEAVAPTVIMRSPGEIRSVAPESKHGVGPLEREAEFEVGPTIIMKAPPVAPPPPPMPAPAPVPPPPAPEPFEAGP